MLIIITLTINQGYTFGQSDSTLNSSLTVDSLRQPTSQNPDLTDSTKQKPRIIRVDDSMDDPIFYSAKDSIYTDLKKKLVHLYTDAKITFGTTVLTADYMVIDLEKNEVTATYTLNEEGERIGEPLFTDGGQEVKAAKMRFNFDTKKAFIEETR